MPHLPDSSYVGSFGRPVIFSRRSRRRLGLASVDVQGHNPSGKRGQAGRVRLRPVDGVCLADAERDCDEKDRDHQGDREDDDREDEHGRLDHCGELGLTWTSPSIGAIVLPREGAEGGAYVHLEADEMAARPRPRNDRFARLLDEAGFTSHKAFARAVQKVSAAAGTPVGCDHTSVSRWLQGTAPRSETAGFIATALSRVLGRQVSLADIGMAAGRPLPVDLGLDYVASPDEAVEVVARLWRADLDEATVLVKGAPNPATWNSAPLNWLVTGAKQRSLADLIGRRVGSPDVERVRATTSVFAQLDNRFGGGHARQALVQFLASDVEPLLRGQYRERAGADLFSAAAEATLLAAWMSYDSGLHGLAQRYFVQALGLAQAGSDRLLPGTILDAMSHQATFLGRFREAANLAGVARAGTQADATPTLTAHFYAMEARALARIGDASGCDLALSQAESCFGRRHPDNDPEWIRYFDEAEFAAEFGHCLRDLGRPAAAAQYVRQSLGSACGPRSDFFATMVLADAHLRAGDAEQACHVALEALQVGQQLKSARCFSYMREFRTHMQPAADTRVFREFDEQAAGSALWRQARGR